jgi:hypothetical protein
MDIEKENIFDHIFPSHYPSQKKKSMHFLDNNKSRTILVKMSQLAFVTFKIGTMSSEMFSITLAYIAPFIFLAFVFCVTL